MSPSIGEAGGDRRTRRNFLKTSATVVGATAMTSLSDGRGLHAAGDDKIRFGLIGCGSRGTGAALQAMKGDPGAELVAVADVFPDHVASTLAKLRREKPKQVAVDDEHGFAGFDAYEKVIQSNVDVVLIACASRYHPAYLAACIDAGKHVFVEKPHAIDPAGVRVVAAACEKAKKKNLSVVSGLHRRYDPAIKETMARIHDGAIGDIVAAEVTFLRAPYRIIGRDPKWSEAEWQFKTWYHFNWLSGDDVPQSMIHTIDAATWAIREEAPTGVHGLGGRSASYGHKYGNVFDHHTVVFEYASGVRVYGMVRTQHGCHGEVQTKLFGTKGVAGERWIRGENEWRFKGRSPGGHQQEQIDFFAALRAGKIINNGDYMVQSTLSTVLGQMACYSGKKLTWKQALESTFAYGPDCMPTFETEPPVKADDKGEYPVPMPGKWKWA